MIQLPGRGRQRAATDVRNRGADARQLLEFGNSWIFLVTFLQAHLACLQLAALVVLYALLLFFFFGLFLPVPLLRPSAKLSLWLLWPAVILTPTLHVTGRACEL